MPDDQPPCGGVANFARHDARTVLAYYILLYDTTLCSEASRGSNPCSALEAIPEMRDPAYIPPKYYNPIPWDTKNKPLLGFFEHLDS